MLVTLTEYKTLGHRKVRRVWKDSKRFPHQFTVGTQR